MDTKEHFEINFGFFKNRLQAYSINAFPAFL